MLIGLAGRRQFGEQHRQEMQALGIDCQWVSSPNDLDNFDGLILSGLVSSDWPDLPDWINRLKDPLWQQRPLFADGWACSILSKSKTALMDYHYSVHKRDKYTAELISAPSWETERLVAVFSGFATFHDIAPNIAVLAHNKRRGAVVLRQGNALACTFLAACTKNKEIYRYFKGILERKL